MGYTTREKISCTTRGMALTDINSEAYERKSFSVPVCLKDICIRDILI